MRTKREFFRSFRVSLRRRAISGSCSAPWRRRQSHTFCGGEIRGQELGRQTHGSTQGMATGGEEVGRELTATRGPKWSEMMPTARRMPFCDTMVAGGEEDMGVGVLGCGCDGGRAAATAAAPSEKKLRTEAGCGCANEAGRAGSTCADGPEAVRTVSQGHRN
jgi:hypothetical protein